MSGTGGKGFLDELKRRNVFRVGIAFIIVAWLLLQVVDILVPMLELPDWVGRLVLLLLLVGFPVALLLAWAFELTPDGIKRDKDVDRSQPTAGATGQKLNLLIIGGLVMAVGYFMWEREVRDDAVEVPASQAANEAAHEQPLHQCHPLVRRHLEAAQLDRVGCFPYSPVEGARANALPDPVDEDTRQERLQRLMEKQAAISAAKLKTKIGSVQRVLVDAVSESGAIARSTADAPEIDGFVYIEEHSDLGPGDFADVRIDATDEHDMWGRFVSRP